MSFSSLCSSEASLIGCENLVIFGGANCREIYIKVATEAVFTVLALLQHAAAVEGARTQASGRVRVARHFGQRRAVERDRYISCCLFLPRAKM